MRFAPSLSLRLAAPLAAAFLSCGVAHAAADAAGTPATYSKERAVCENIASPESKAACIREAGAAQQAARGGQLSSRDANTYGQNAEQRCAAFPTASERAECVNRTQNQPASGSVQGGGVLRESETTTVIPAAKP